MYNTNPPQKVVIVSPEEALITNMHYNQQARLAEAREMDQKISAHWQRFLIRRCYPIFPLIVFPLFLISIGSACFQAIGPVPSIELDLLGALKVCGLYTLDILFFGGLTIISLCYGYYWACWPSRIVYPFSIFMYWDDSFGYALIICFCFEVIAGLVRKVREESGQDAR